MFPQNTLFLLVSQVERIISAGYKISCLKKLSMLCLVGIVPKFAYAQLTWDSKILETRATLEDVNAHVVFRFKNQGAYPITIVEVRTSCGCTTVELGQKRYNPGESGSINVAMDIEGKIGLQEKYINVKSDDSHMPNEQLCFRVQLPELLRIIPSFLSWQPGDYSPKTVQITATDNIPIKIQQVNFDNEMFSVVWKQQEKIGEYKLVITPRIPVDEQKSKITIISDYPHDLPRAFSILTYITNDFK